MARACLQVAVTDQTMAFSSKGRCYENGKPVCNEIRGQIIDCILEEGGDRTTGYFPLNWKWLGGKFDVEGSTAKRIWKNFCTNRFE